MDSHPSGEFEHTSAHLAARVHSCRCLMVIGVGWTKRPWLQKKTFLPLENGFAALVTANNLATILPMARNVASPIWVRSKNTLETAAGMSQEVAEVSTRNGDQTETWLFAEAPLADS
jgi:hypothetical protein